MVVVVVVAALSLSTQLMQSRASTDTLTVAAAMARWLTVGCQVSRLTTVVVESVVELSGVATSPALSSPSATPTMTSSVSAVTTAEAMRLPRSVARDAIASRLGRGC